MRLRARTRTRFTGDTTDLARARGDRASERSIVAGVRLWY
ncbi:MAG: copper resistance protein B [Burkholderiaceae bacterium]|nr:copper resistance protein B [Burkholderiaceae bacterium]